LLFVFGRTAPFFPGAVLVVSLLDAKYRLRIAKGKLNQSNEQTGNSDVIGCLQMTRKCASKRDGSKWREAALNTGHKHGMGKRWVTRPPSRARFRGDVEHGANPPDDWRHGLWVVIPAMRRMFSLHKGMADKTHSYPLTTS
jgi:hypothetical protein